MVRARAAARLVYEHEMILALSARPVSKITYPVIISVQDVHQWIGQLHFQSSQVWYSSRAPVQSACIL